MHYTNSRLISHDPTNWYWFENGFSQEEIDRIIHIANNLERSLALTWSVIFAITIVCALSWARLFYINHNIGSASIALSLTAMFTIPLLVLAYKSDWRVGLALTPYQMWVITASFLSFSYYKLN